MRALESAGRASEPAGRAPEPVGRASEPAERPNGGRRTKIIKDNAVFPVCVGTIEPHPLRSSCPKMERFWHVVIPYVIVRYRLLPKKWPTTKFIAQRMTSA